MSLRIPAATLAAAVLAATAAAHAEAGWPELFRRAAATAAVEAPSVAYDFVNEIGGDKPRRVKGRYDGSRPEGDRVTVLEASGGEVDLKKIDEGLEERMDGDIWCDDLAASVDGAVADAGAAAGARTFTFRPKPGEDASGEEKRIYRQVTASIVVEEASARIRSYSAVLDKPLRSMLVAKINSFKLDATCQPGPGGRPFVAEMRMAVAGSAVGGKFAQEMTQRLSNVVSR